ncbi:hypothetical protein ACHQM5_023420 [Ranunculus cassubicifolius]
MGLSQFLRFLLISTVLALCISQGLCGIKLMGFVKEDSTGLLKDPIGSDRISDLPKSGRIGSDTQP